MASLSRFFIGGLGGLLPILAMVVTVDIAVLSALMSAEKLSWGIFLGFGARVLGLFCLGGILAWANRSISEPLALLQIGIAAPALVTSYLSGAAAKTEISRQAHFEVFSIFTPANAAALDPRPDVQMAASFLDDFGGAFSGSYTSRIDPFVDPMAKSYKVQDRATRNCFSVTVGDPGQGAAIMQTFPSDRFDVSEGFCDR